MFFPQFASSVILKTKKTVENHSPNWFHGSFKYFHRSHLFEGTIKLIGWFPETHVRNKSWSGDFKARHLLFIVFLITWFNLFEIRDILCFCML